MTQPVPLTGGWSCFQEVDGGDVGGKAAAADLIHILDGVDVPIVVMRHDLTLACFNKASGVLGLLRQDIGRASRDIPVLAAFPRLEQQCTRVIACGVETRVDFRDGDRWYVVRISPHTKVDHQVNGAVLTFTNVTAFRASIDQAIYERECTKAILNTVAEPLVVLSADQRIQSGNRAFFTMFGVTRDETQRTPFYELGNGVFALAPLREQLKAMLAASGPFQPVEVDHVATVKGERTLILDAHPLSFPGHTERRVLVTFQDVTERKKAEAAKDLRSEEELRRSEAFLAEGQRLSLTGSFSWKLATDEMTWSEQLYRIFEFEPGTRVTIERINSRVHPEDAQMMNERIERARAGGADFEYAHRLLMPDRSVKYVNAIAHGSIDGEGRLEYIGAVQDVTHRRLSEEALRNSQARLSRAIQTATVGEFAASIAHEINQPLAAVVANGQACLRWLAAEPPVMAKAREAAERIVRDGKGAGEVIRRIRALFKCAFR